MLHLSAATQLLPCKYRLVDVTQDLQVVAVVSQVWQGEVQGLQIWLCTVKKEKIKNGEREEI